MAVHRYKANASGESEEVVKQPKPASKKTPKKTVAKTAKTEKVVEASKSPSGPLRRIKEYFVGSWQELRQVRWPNRKQTWALTIAVILFSLFLGVLIFLLDAGFTYLFKKVIF